MPHPIEAFEDALRDAMLAADVEALDGLIHGDLLFVGPDGGLYRKADDLAAYRSCAQRMHRIDVLERAIEDHGSMVAVVTVAALELTLGDTAVSGTYRYLRVWLAVGDTWQVAAGGVAAAAS